VRQTSGDSTPASARGSGVGDPASMIAGLVDCGKARDDVASAVTLPLAPHGRFSIPTSRVLDYNARLFSFMSRIGAIGWHRARTITIF
jgi:hypothetical protein